MRLQGNLERRVEDLKLQIVRMARDLVMPILAGLPPHPGWLPKWLMLVAVVSVINGLQNYISLSGAKKVYTRQKHFVTALQSRNFGTWTLTSGVIRFYAAYNISNVGLYHLAAASFIIALLHFSLEVSVYRTAGWGVLAPFLVASVSLGWMIKQYDHYVV